MNAPTLFDIVDGHLRPLFDFETPTADQFVRTNHERPHICCEAGPSLKGVARSLVIPVASDIPGRVAPLALHQQRARTWLDERNIDPDGATRMRNRLNDCCVRCGGQVVVPPRRSTFEPKVV